MGMMLGDKTQLAMIAMAAESGSIWSVLLGGTAALLFLAFALLAFGQVFIGSSAVA